MIKVKLFTRFIPNRWEYILNHKKHMELHGIKFVENLNEADVLMFTFDWQHGGKFAFSNLSQLYKYLMIKKNIPLILIERADSSVTWFRDFDVLPNLKAVFKNYTIRPPSLNNSFLYRGRYHYQRVKEMLESNILIKEEISNSYFKLGKSEKYKQISDDNLEKIKTVIWDWNSSYMNQNFNELKRTDIDIYRERKIDVFCVNYNRNDIQAWARNRAKNILKI
jgi:hypothetical protein